MLGIDPSIVPPAMQATIYGVLLMWCLWAGSCFYTWYLHYFDVVEAKAKALLTFCLSIALFGFWVHWSVAFLFVLLGFSATSKANHG